MAGGWATATEAVVVHVTERGEHGCDEELLERTDRSVDQIASDVGFANAATLRHHFTRVRGLSPQRYRQLFGASAVQAEQVG